HALDAVPEACNDVFADIEYRTDRLAQARKDGRDDLRDGLDQLGDRLDQSDRQLHDQGHAHFDELRQITGEGVYNRGNNLRDGRHDGYDDPRQIAHQRDEQINARLHDLRD